MLKAAHPLSARRLAEQVAGTLAGNEQAWDQPLMGVSTLSRAKTGQLSFLSAKKHRHLLPACQASAIILNAEAVPQAPSQAALILVADPYLAYAQVSGHFSRGSMQQGVHPSAVIGQDVVVGQGVFIAAGVVIGDGCVLGDGCQIGANSVLGDEVKLGKGCQLAPQVTLYSEVQLGEYCCIHAGTAIGVDGFGYAPNQGRWQKIHQLGRVIVGDRVEIGANCTIDRGALEDTLIGDDVIIDNLVHLAHNVVIGPGTALAGQVGIAGSSQIGAACVLGGQVGVAGHLSLAEGSHFTGQTMVTKGTQSAGVYSSGWPMQTNKEWRKTVVYLRQLQQINQRLKTLEQQQENG